MSEDQPLTGDELATTPSKVAQALIDHAGRVSDLGSRSALLAASRIVDSVLLENLRLVAEIERLQEQVEAKDAALKFKQETIDDLAAQVQALEEDRNRG